MFEKLRKILGIESLAEKVDRYEIVSESLNIVNQKIDELAKSFFIEKSLFDKRMNDPDNYRIQDKIQEKFNSFLDIHKAEIKTTKKQFSNLNKVKESLSKDPRIEKALQDLRKRESYQKIKKSYQDGNISLQTFNSIIKGITKEEVTKYADFLLFNEDGELLLLKRSEWEDDNQGAWVIPGGHVDPGEEFKAAAIRELREESGFNVTDCENVGSYQDDKAHIEYFQATINTKEQSPLLDFMEARDLKWVPLDEVCEYEMVFNMRENIERILNIPKIEKVSIIKKADVEENLTQEENMENKEQKAQLLKKALISDVIDIDTFNKAIQNLNKLVPMKVTIHGKNGTYQATRWIDPSTGQAEHSGNRRPEVDQTNPEAKIHDILNSGLSASDKLRDLVNMGIYDKNLLCTVTGTNYSQVHAIVGRESNIDPKLLPAIEKVKNEIRAEQANNDTPEARETNTLLRDIPIDELWDNYERNLTKVINNRHKFAIAYGTGGVGKTFTFRELAKKFELREYDEEIQPTKDQYDFVVVSGKITPTQVYAEMFRHRDKLIVFDDCDSFLATEEVQGFLKAGLDTGETTKISNKSSRKMYMIEGDNESGQIPSTFTFLGRVIAITNLTATEIDQPIKSRALCSNLTMTIDETVEKLGTIKDKIKIYTADKAETIDVSTKARDLAYEMIKINKDKLKNDINTRTYSNAILMAHDGFEDGLSEERVRREINSYFDSVTGDFDNKMRKQKGK